MEGLWSIVVGVFVVAGIYLMLEWYLLCLLFGLIFFSSVVNLVIFIVGCLIFVLLLLIEVGVLLLVEGVVNLLL